MKTAFRNLIAIGCGLALGWAITKAFMQRRESAVSVEVSTNAATGVSAASGDDTATKSLPSAADEKREWEDYLAKVLPPGSPFKASEVQTRLAELAAQAARGNPIRADVERRWLLATVPVENLSGLIAGAKSWPNADSAFAPWEELFRCWAASDPQAALDATINLPPSKRRAVIGTVISRWVETDPRAALAYVESGKDSALQFDGLRAALGALAKSDPQLALAHVGSAGSAEARTLRADIIETWAAHDGAAAAEWVARESASGERDRNIARVLMTWGQNQPQEAARYALDLPESADRAGTLAAIFRYWTMRDPNGAIDGLLALPDDRGNAEIIESVAGSLAMSPGSGKDAALAAADRFPKGVQRDAFLAGLVKFGANNDVEFAVQLAPLLPEGRTREVALGFMAEVWGKKDAYKTAQWLNTLPPSPSTDSAAGHFANAAVELDPTGAVQWAASIQNAQTRSSYLNMVFEKWRMKNAGAADTWLRDTTLFSAEEKEKLRR